MTKYTSDGLEIYATVRHKTWNVTADLIGDGTRVHWRSDDKLLSNRLSRFLDFAYNDRTDPISDFHFDPTDDAIRVAHEHTPDLEVLYRKPEYEWTQEELEQKHKGHIFF